MKTQPIIELLTCRHPDTGELITEEFRPIKGYEGKYEISSFGRVKSLNFGMTGKPGLLGLYTNNGYHIATLSNKIIKSFQVHQLVAIAFLNHTPCGYKLVVNHKDLKRDNNHVYNLEIVTLRQNNNRKHIPHSSQYTGVHWNNKKKQWVASVKSKGKSKRLGYFDIEKDASDAYEAAVKQIELCQK